MNELTKIDYEQLYKNCVYSSIAHAIFTLKEPFFSYTQSWDDYNDSFHHGTTRGTLSFYKNDRIVVGAARDEHSTRRKLYPNYDAIKLFAEASEQIKALALQDPLEYLYDEEEDVVKPIASIGFWLDRGSLSSSDSIEEFNINGGAYVFIISQSFDTLMQYWRDEYQFSDDEMAVVNQIYSSWEQNRKIDVKDVKRVINKKCVGFNECIVSLNEIGILL